MSISKGSQSDLISVIMDVQNELVSLITSEVTLKKEGEYLMVCGVFTLLSTSGKEKKLYPLPQLCPNSFSRN